MKFQSHVVVLEGVAVVVQHPGQRLVPNLNEKRQTVEELKKRNIYERLH